MKLQRLLGALCAGLMLISPVMATEQATYVTPIAGPMDMATFTGTYLNPALRALATCHNGSTAPANGPSSLPLTYQCWVDTTANPSLYKIYDGASWITLGSINTSTHVWSPYFTGGVSGGVPFFSATNVMGSSALLAQYGFMVGGGAAAAPATIAACTDDQIAFGRTSNSPLCRAVTGDVTFATGVATIGATKVVSAMLNADVFSTAHTWAGQQTFVAPILGTPASGTLTNATGLPISTGVSGLGTGVATALAVNVGTAGSPVVNGGALGTPSSGTATNITGLPISTGVSGLGTNIAAFLATPSSANLRAALTDEVGSGAAYFVGGALGTPASGTATNLTGLPVSTGITGFGTGVATALAVNVGSAGAPVVNGGALGTPSSGTATNLTGLPLTTGVTGTLAVGNGGTGATSITSTLDTAFSSTQGSVLYRNATQWVALAPGTAGQFLTTQGAAANPNWSSGGAGTGTVTSIATGAGLTGGPITASGTISVDGTFEFRNRLINPSGQINQAGVGSQTDGTYDFDQWLTLTETAAVTVSQITAAENGTPYMMRSSQAQASAQRFGRIQWIENANVADLRGQSTCVSARVRMSASTTLRYAIVEWTGTADTITKDIVNNWASGTFTTGNFFTSTSTTITVTGSTALTANTLTSVSACGTVGSSMTNLAVFFWTDSTQAQNVTLDVGKAQLEVGTQASNFAPRPLQIENLLCQRYFRKTTIGSGIAYDANNVSMVVPHAGMRATPSVSAAAAIQITDIAFTNPIQSSANATAAGGNADAAAYNLANFTGLTVGRYYTFYNASPTPISLNARL